jgi:hypothetical protein
MLVDLGCPYQLKLYVDGVALLIIVGHGDGHCHGTMNMSLARCDMEPCMCLLCMHAVEY